MQLPLTDFEKTYISSATTTQVATGKCILEKIVVNATVASTIGIIDGTSGTTVNVAQLKASVAEGSYSYGIAMKNGIRIVTGGASDVTVVWQQA